MTTPRRLSFLGLTIFCLAVPVIAQSDSTRIVQDTTILVPPIQPETTVVASPPSAQDTSSAVFHPSKSPWLAVGMSAVLPGSGQIYNTDYWKAPVIWGISGYWIYEWIQLNNKYKDFRDLYLKSLETSSTGNSQYLTNRDFYHDERDKFAWFLGALYFINLVDAYVGANLYDFDVSPDLGMNGQTVPRVTATLRWKF